MNLKLDPTGHMYACTASKKTPGTFGMAVCLNEPVDPIALQNAVDKLLENQPHLNIGLKRGFFWYGFQPLAQTLKIKSADDWDLKLFEEGGHLFRVCYGKYKIHVEVSHTLCDGRGLVFVVSQLLAYYFNPGLAPAQANAEEDEDAYLRYADQKTKSSTLFSPKAFQVKRGAAFGPGMSKSISVTMKASEVKACAKQHGLTITEYFAAHILWVITKEKGSNQQPVSLCAPIDCRSFFPSNTTRNFSAMKDIVVANADSFCAVAAQVKQQFAQIDKTYVMGYINSTVKMIKQLNRIPLFMKKPVTPMVVRMAAATTTCFSNIGLVKLPAEVQAHVTNLEFAIGCEAMKYPQFSCVSVGDTLTLTASQQYDNIDLAQRVFAAVDENRAAKLYK